MACRPAPRPDIIGIVTGLASEAKLARTMAARHAPEGSVLVYCAGPGPDKAGDAARRLLEDGAGALASVGVAGGLKLSLWPGTVIIARTVIAADETRHEVDPDWHRLLLGAVLGDDEVVDGDLLESTHPVIKAADKQALFEKSGAGAVDMESAAVAAVADAAGVPFVALRAIADPAELGLPRAALAALNPDGSVSPVSALLQALARPAEIPALIRLAYYSCRASASLRRVLAATAALTAGGPVEEV